MDSSVRLAFYVPSLTGGGAQRVTVNLVNGFATRGVDVDLVVSYDTGALKRQVRDDVTLVDLNTAGVPVVGIGASIPALARYLREETPSVLFSQMHYANVISVVARELSTRKTRLVLTEHTTFGRVEHPKDALVFALARRLHPHADHVIAVSAGVERSVRNEIDVPNGQLSVINNPIVTSTLRERAELSVDHLWLNDPNIDVVLGVGRLEPEKDFTTLVEAFAIALREEPSLRLVILGEGSERETLHRTAAALDVDEQVSLPGYVENPYPFMRHADVFALSSRREGLPTALVEAMACGCPVVATDCRSGPREVLADGRYGPLVPVEGPDALAVGIQQVLRQPVSSATLRERAEDYAVETVLDEYERLIDELV